MSEISLHTLKKPPSLWEEDTSVGISKMSIDSSTSGASYSRSRQSAQRVPVQANSNLTVRNDSRTFNTINFVPSADVGYVPGASLSLIDTMSPDAQELLLTEELLKVLTGAQSYVIQVHESTANQISFTVSS